MEENKFTFVKLEESAAEHIAAPHYSYWKSVFRRFFSNKVAITMLIIALAITLMAFIQPLFSGYDPLNKEFINTPSMWYLPPSLEYPFGTDQKGMNMFDAVWAGTGMSLKIAFIATTISTVLGVIVGAFWGYSKKLDVIMIEIYNIIYNVPFTLVVMILMYILGQGQWQLIFALSCTSWLGTAYFIRVQVMIIRDREYNLASRCLGTPTSKVIKHNILPYLISVIVTSVARDIPNFISYEVFLSYLGVGLTEAEPSLGRMVQNYVQFIQAPNASYMFWIPICVCAMISISLYIVGQTLADASDPRTHMI